MTERPMETRAGAPVEVRAEGDTVTVAGYAAVFNQEADIGGMFVERIAPGAFDQVLTDDVVFLVNHDGLPLARTRSGTLTIRQDAIGLHVESELDAADPDVQAVVRKMRRGDVDKMSFAFTVGAQEWEDDLDPPRRTITRMSRLHDVSVVTTPAYEGTSIALRSLDAHRERQARTENFNAVRRRRMRMKTHLAARRRENGDR